MIRVQKKMILLSIVLLMSLILFGCNPLADNVKVFTGESKHWKARFELTKKADDNGNNGGLQLEFIEGKLPLKVEYEFNFANVESKGSFRLDDNMKSPTFRSSYDFEGVQNSIMTVVIKWNGFEEKIPLKTTDN